MKNLKSILISETLNNLTNLFLLCLLALFIFPSVSFGKIIIDVSSPAQRKWKVAIPDFKNLSDANENPGFSEQLPKVISGDLDLSSYFLPMDKNSFLGGDGDGITSDSINFRNWSLIGTELLIKGAYTCIGRNLEVTVRLYDPVLGKQVFGKRYLGKVDDYRELMHRIGDDIILKFTGQKGVFGSSFLFVNNSTGNKEIYMCDFDGYNIKRITSDKSIALSPRWSPKGGRFVFTSYREDQAGLYVKDISSGKIRKVSGSEEGFSGSWANDGKSLDLTLNRKGDSDIYNVDLNGKIKEKLVGHRGIDISSSRSPDGSKIVFTSGRSGLSQVYVKDLKTGSEERITFDFNEATSPVWSSKGRIAFDGITKGKHDIYTINPDGTGLKQLTDSDGNNEDPCWSPDGMYIVFSSNRSGGYHLYIMNAYGYNQRRITYFKGEETAPSWSPLE